MGTFKTLWWQCSCYARCWCNLRFTICLRILWCKQNEPVSKSLNLQLVDKLLLSHSSGTGKASRSEWCACFPYQVCNWIAVSGSYNVIRFTTVGFIHTHAWTHIFSLATQIHYTEHKYYWVKHKHSQAVTGRQAHRLRKCIYSVRMYKECASEFVCACRHFRVNCHFTVRLVQMTHIKRGTNKQ